MRSGGAAARFAPDTREPYHLRLRPTRKQVHIAHTSRESYAARDGGRRAIVSAARRGCETCVRANCTRQVLPVVTSPAIERVRVEGVTVQFLADLTEVGGDSGDFGARRGLKRPISAFEGGRERARARPNRILGQFLPISPENCR